MKVICDRDALLEAVNLVAAVVPTRTPTPQLSCVKLSATKGDDGAGELTLGGTDAETSLHLTLDRVDVQTPGEAALPADKLRQILSAEDSGATLAIEVEGDQCSIRGEKSRYRVFGYPAREFPPLPDYASVISGSANDPVRSVFTAEAGLIQDIIERTTFATARETSRYAINGVLLKRDGKKLEMVATDGRRLAVCRVTLPSKEGADGPVSCIIPTKALNLLTKLLGDADDPLKIAVTDNRVYFALGSPGEKEDAAPRAVLTSALVEGAFPPYEDVIPKDQDKKVTARRDELLSAVRRAAVLTNEESRGVRMSFDAGDKRLKLTSRAPELGDAEIDVGLTDYTGEDIEISFNPAFITDVLKVVHDDDIIIELKASNKPGVVRSDNGNFTYVVMPVNLPG